MGPLPVWRRPVALATLGLAFVALALVTRLPFLDRTLFISDSARYAFALERYDMTAGRPHPPGNPLYVGLAAAIDHFVQDPPLSLGVLSALMSGMAMFFAYLLGRDLAGEASGRLAAGIFLVSPLFWFFGCVAMPATGEAALSLAFAWVARRARAPVEASSFWWMTALLALAFGYRSTFAVLMLPLWAYAAWRHPRRRVLAGAAVLLLGFFAWTTLVATLSGGWSAYRQTSGAFLSEVVLATKILGGGFGKVPAQAQAIATSAVFAFGPFLVPGAAGLIACLWGRSPFPGGGRFLAAWALPMLAFHLVYDWAPRFGVPLMAPAVVLAAAAAGPLARQLARSRSTPLPHALVLLGLAINVGLFLLPVRLGTHPVPDPYPSGPRLLARNAELSRRDAEIRARFDPRHTVVLAYDHAMHAAYFLPDYFVVGLFPVFQRTTDAWVPSAHRRKFSFEQGSTALPPDDPLHVPPSIERVVLYDRDYLRYWPHRTLPLRQWGGAPGAGLLFAPLPEDGCLDYAYRHMDWRPAGTEGCAGATSIVRATRRAAPAKALP